MSSTLRTRLTLFYVGAFSVVLISFSTGVYFFDWSEKIMGKLGLR